MSNERNTVPNPPRRNASMRPQQDPSRIIWKAGGPPQLELRETVLFYPGVGSDWRPPVQLFGAWIDTFVFVDRSLGGISDSLSRSLLPFNLKTDRSHALDRIERSVVQASLESGRTIEIRWLQEDALEAITQLDDRIGVFFYRGDSSEGSNLWWLFHTEQGEVEGDADGREEEEEEEEEEANAPHGLFHDVLSRLANGGLIVTDGSKGNGDGAVDPDDAGSYSQISSFRGRDVAPEKAMNQAESFKGPLGHTFECIGCIAQVRPSDKGPVLIWQVRSA